MYTNRYNTPTQDDDKFFILFLNKNHNHALFCDSKRAKISFSVSQCLFQPLGVVPASSEPGTPSVVDFTVGTQHPLTLQLNSSPINMEQCRSAIMLGLAS